MKLLSKIFILFSFVLYAAHSIAQLSIPALPKSFSLNTFTNTDTKIIGGINKDSLLIEDAITDKYKDIPWRFGKIVNVNYSLKNSGYWTVLPNGDKIWKLKIITPDAVSININYAHFYIPDGAQFFLYTSDKKQVLGAFTALNHNPDMQFATALTYSNAVTLEYYEPFNAEFEGSIELAEIVYGYRSLNDKAKGYLDSEPCNVDVVCDSIQWKTEMRSVVMLLT